MSEEQKELSVACQSLGDWTRTHTCGELTGPTTGRKSASWAGCSTGVTTAA